MGASPSCQVGVNELERSEVGGSEVEAGVGAWLYYGACGRGCLVVLRCIGTLTRKASILNPQKDLTDRATMLSMVLPKSLQCNLSRCPWGRSVLNSPRSSATVSFIA